MEKFTVAVVLGGRSVEHPVSCASAAGVMGALRDYGHEVVPLGITPRGKWVALDADATQLALRAGRMPEITPESGQDVALSADPTSSALVVTDTAGGAALMSDVDVVFPVLHGAYGEDGTIQGLLEMADVPYVGSGVLASAASMDKEFSKRLMRAEGIPVGPYEVLRSGEELSERAKASLGLPVFVKPARAGSSLGISRVVDWADLPRALEAARAVDPKVLIEASFTGFREIECGVLARPEAGPPETTAPFEVLGTNDEGWFDFDSKYLGVESPYDLDPRLPAGTAERIRELAARVFTALDCSDLARVDFFMSPEGELFVNELNTMPGMTPQSGVPVAWEAAGLKYPELVDRLVRMAVQRGTGPR